MIAVKIVFRIDQSGFTGPPHNGPVRLRHELETCA